MPAVAKKTSANQAKNLLAKRRSAGTARFKGVKMLPCPLRKTIAVKTKGTRINFDLSDEVAKWQNCLVEAGAKLLIE